MNKGGRPTGSTTRPQIRDFLTKDQIDKLVETAYDMAIEKKEPLMVKFLMEQVYGKAPQNLEVSGNLGLTVQFDGIFKTSQQAEGSDS